MELNKTLIVIATVALAAFNIGALSIGGVVVAALLGIVVLVLSQRKVIREYGIYAFLVAELSPLGLQSQAWLAFLYQGLCLLLLAAVLSSFDSVRPFGEYRAPFLKILAAVSVFLGLTGLVLYVKPFDASGPQLLGLTAGSALVILTAALFIEHEKIRLPQLGLRGSKL